MRVIIDSRAGFCPGVVRAIRKAEEILAREQGLTCLGQIVHNESEAGRLEAMGMNTATQVPAITPEHAVVMIRAHGEPPATYQALALAGATVTDATCPVVLRLQRRVAEASQRMKEVGGQVVIFGKAGHPETLGLIGNAQGNAVLASPGSPIPDLSRFSRLEIFSQTTMDTVEYDAFVSDLRRQGSDTGADRWITAHQTICGAVSGRKESLAQFAREVDVLFFVAGRASSNGKVLFSVAQESNPVAYFISGPDEVREDWVVPGRLAGISGATSTPMWLMRQVADRIRQIAAGKEVGNVS